MLGGANLPQLAFLRKKRISRYWKNPNNLYKNNTKIRQQQKLNKTVVFVP